MYSVLGQVKAFWSVIRIAILPFWKIDNLVGDSHSIIDIGCGNGALANYLAISKPSRNILGMDLSRTRINDAKKTIIKNGNVKFLYGNVVSKKLPKVDFYLICDVLHHIDYPQQEVLLAAISKKVKKGSKLILKEVDPSNKLPFLFGHLWEKILYPNEKINVRAKKDWLKLLKNLGFSCRITGGAFYFPDSTIIFDCEKKI